MAIYEGSPSNMAEEDGPSNQGDDSGVDTQRASPQGKTKARRKAKVSFAYSFPSKKLSLF